MLLRQSMSFTYPCFLGTQLMYKLEKVEKFAVSEFNVGIIKFHYFQIQHALLPTPTFTTTGSTAVNLTWRRTMLLMVPNVTVV